MKKLLPFAAAGLVLAACGGVPGNSVATVDGEPIEKTDYDHWNTVVKRALELNASAVVLAHNHPAGDPTPSAADIDMTRKVVEAARALGIAVHDHFVVGGDTVASFKGLGLL